MIKVLKASEKSTINWSKKEWHKVDIAHYGHHVEWNGKHFRFKAVDGKKLVGLIDGKHESGVLFIDTIITKDSYRGKGVGTMLIKKAEEFGKKMGAHMIWLITGKVWQENAFYIKLGFKKIADLPNWHFHTDFVIYTKEILS
jgi:ribosomal protein S18 acetylase RimI-like enzyme